MVQSTVIQTEVLISSCKVQWAVVHLLLFSLCSLAISIERFNLSINHCLSGRQVKYCATLI